MPDPACPACGTPNAADARWCGHCGAALEGPGTWRGALTNLPWRAVAGVVVGLVVVGAAAIVVTGDGPERPERGAVGLPSTTPAPGGDRPVPDAGPVVWDTTRTADAPVAATASSVVVGLPDGLPRGPLQPALQILERSTGRSVGGVAVADMPRVLGSEPRRVAFAIGEREALVLEFATEAGRLGFVSRALGDVAGSAERLSGTGALLRRVLFPRDDHAPDALYVLAGSDLVALEPTAGERWRWTDQHVLSAGTAASGPYVVTVDGVVALDPATGETRWRQPLITFANRSHLVARGAIVIADDEGQVTALAAEDGAVRWQVDRGGPLAQGLVALGDAVIATYLGGTVVAYDAVTGDEQWAFVRDGVRFELLVGGGDVLALADPGRPESVLHVLDAATGEPLWQRPARRLGDVVVDGDTLLLVTDAAVTAVDARTGRQRWALELDGPIDVVDADGDAVLATPTRVVVVRPPAG